MAIFQGDMGQIRGPKRCAIRFQQFLVSSKLLRSEPSSHEWGFEGAGAHPQNTIRANCLDPDVHVRSWCVWRTWKVFRTACECIEPSFNSLVMMGIARRLTKNVFPILAHPFGLRFFAFVPCIPSSSGSAHLGIWAWTHTQ